MLASAFGASIVASMVTGAFFIEGHGITFLPCLLSERPRRCYHLPSPRHRFQYFASDRIDHQRAPDFAPVNAMRERRGPSRPSMITPNIVSI